MASPGTILLKPTLCKSLSGRAAMVMLPAKLHTSPGSIWELHACTNGESGNDLFANAGRKTAWHFAAEGVSDSFDFE